MRNQALWQESKYIYKKGKLTASRNPKEVMISSRLIADLVAEFYDNHLAQHAKGKLLDLGCGKIPLYKAYKNYIDTNICVDWGNTLHKNDFIDYEVDLTKDMPFSNDEFDTIILSDVLEHIPVPEQFWSEMARILAKNGKIIMNVPFYYWIHEQPYDYYRYTEFALRRFVEMSGLKLIQIEPIGGALEVIADVVSKIILRLPLLGRTLAIIIQWFAIKFAKTNQGKKLLKSTSSGFPLGYFLIAQKQ